MNSFIKVFSEYLTFSLIGYSFHLPSVHLYTGYDEGTSVKAPGDCELYWEGGACPLHLHNWAIRDITIITFLLERFSVSEDGTAFTVTSTQKLQIVLHHDIFIKQSFKTYPVVSSFYLKHSTEQIFHDHVNNVFPADAPRRAYNTSQQKQWKEFYMTWKRWERCWTGRSSLRCPSVEKTIWNDDNIFARWRRKDLTLLNNDNKTDKHGSPV